jgi:uncharacterized DUF497 family protein
MKIVIYWTRSSVVHTAKHEVKAKEVEEALKDRNVYLWKEKHSKVPYLYCIGSTGERYLFIVLRYSKRYNKYILKSARDATEKEKKLYFTPPQIELFQTSETVA